MKSMKISSYYKRIVFWILCFFTMGLSAQFELKYLAEDLSQTSSEFRQAINGDDFQAYRTLVARNYSHQVRTNSKVLKLFTRLDSDGFASLQTKLVESLDEAALLKFADDFGQGADLVRFENAPGLVDAWKVLDDAGETGLANRIDDIEFIDDYVKTSVKTHSEIKTGIDQAGGFSKWKINNAGGGLAETVNKLKLISSKYSDDALNVLAKKADELGLDLKYTEDFIKIGDIKGFDASELVKQMDNWVNVVKKPGFPHGFNTISDFSVFKGKVKKLLNQVNIKTYDIRVQGSSLRKTTPKDIDLAIFLKKNDFDDLVKSIRVHYKKINDRAGKITKNSRSFEREIKKGKINSFHFDNLPDGRTFDKAKFQDLGDVDISIISEGKTFDISPYLEF